MQQHRTIYVCQGTGCISGGGDAVYEALRSEVTRQGVNGAEVDFTGCHGFCEQGPNVVVEPDGIFYTHVVPEVATEIVTSHLQNGVPVERLFYDDPVSGSSLGLGQDADVVFDAAQDRVVVFVDVEEVHYYATCRHHDPGQEKNLLFLASVKPMPNPMNAAINGRFL